MKQSHFARKCRQLKLLAEQVQKESRNGAHINSPAVRRLLIKMKILWSELRGVFSTIYLKRLLGPVAAIIGITVSHAVSAQSFAPHVMNPFNMEIIAEIDLQPAFADFDGDGDLDVIWGGIIGSFQYFENTGSASVPEFASGILNPFGLQSPDDFALPTAVDLDNDGDFDLLVALYYGNYNYYENTGTPSDPLFAAPVLNPFGLIIPPDFSSFPVIADMDGDGDFDILASGYYAAMNYFENIGTPEAPEFAGVVQSPFNFVATGEFVFPMLGDLDMDGDIDMLTRDYYGNFFYYENVGTSEVADFAVPVTAPFGLSLVGNPLFGPAVLVDLDDDGDLDILQNDYFGNIIYIENTTIVMSQENVEIADLTIFPNPTADYLNIRTEADIQNVEILDMQGRVIAGFGKERIISLKEFANGTYLVRLMTGAGIVVRKIQVGR